MAERLLRSNSRGISRYVDLIAVKVLYKLPNASNRLYKTKHETSKKQEIQSRERESKLDKISITSKNKDKCFQQHNILQNEPLQCNTCEQFAFNDEYEYVDVRP